MVFTEMFLQRVSSDSQWGESRVIVLKIMPLLLLVQSLGKGLLLVLSFLRVFLSGFSSSDPFFQASNSLYIVPGVGRLVGWY